MENSLSDGNELLDIWKIRDDDISGYLKIIEGKKYFITKNKIKKLDDKYLEIYRQNRGNEKIQLNYDPIRINNVNFYQVLNDIQNEYFDENYRHLSEDYKIAIDIFKEKKTTNKMDDDTLKIILCIIIFILILYLGIIINSKINNSNSNPNPNPPLQENLNESIPVHKVYTEKEYNPQDNIYYVKMEDNNEIYNKHGTIKYDNGNIKYIGPFKNNVAHGNGKYYDRDNNFTIKFEGNFTDGYFESGTLYLDYGNYTGNFKNSKYEGRGIFLYNNGNKYNGTWKNGLREEGRIDYANGEYYNGHWANNKNNKPEGNGTYKYSNKDIYEGEFKNGLRDGKGIYYWAEDGDFYEGGFKNDLRDGKGIYYWAEGGYYNGSYKKNLREGKGKLYFGKERDCNYYEGDFKNGTKHGSGTYVYLNKEKYVGEWKNNTRDGYGYFTYKNGDFYKGHWKNDRREGIGILIYTDEYYYEGHWENDKRQGKGEIKIKKNGETKYSGNFKNDHYDYGFGKFLKKWIWDYPHD